MGSPPTATPFPRIGASVVLWQGDAVLLVHRRGGPYAGKWSLPGGHVVFGERLVAAAKRELLEETGVSATIGSAVGIFEIVMDQPRPAHFVLMTFGRCIRIGRSEGWRRRRSGSVGAGNGIG